MARRVFAVTFVAGMLVLSAGTATAAPTFFTSRATFDAATGGGLSFESFEAPWNDTNGVANFADFSVSETGGTNNLFHATEAGGNSFSVTDGIDSVWYDDNGPSIATFFSFDAPVTAFGLDITFAQGNGTAVTSTVTIGGSVNSSIALAANQPRFWGVIDSDGISSVSFDASGNGFVGFDAVSYQIPEPASITLLVLAAVAVGRRFRRR